MKKTFCDLCGEECKDNYYDGDNYVTCRKYFAYDRTFDGVETSDDNLVCDLCNECEIRIYKAFIRRFMKENSEEKIRLGKDWTVKNCVGYVHLLKKGNKIGWYDFGKFVKEKYGKKLEK